MAIDEIKKYRLKDYNELLEKIARRLRQLETPLPSKKLRNRLGLYKNYCLRRIDTVYNILVDEIDYVVEALAILSRQHVFYKELFKMWTSYYPEQVRKHLIYRRRIIRRIHSDYRERIKHALTLYETRRYYRACIGRMLSVLKRRRRLLRRVKEAFYELKKMPSIRDDELKVIVAGMPQVGKSTLVSKLSTAQPEIASYPFTTKTIIVGHMIREPETRIAFIDTPGLLDRPLEERNEIELKAVLALKYLADKTVYLIDASPVSYYSIGEQYRVLDDVYRIVGGEVIICLNKVDITPREKIEAVKKDVIEKYGVEPLEISAKTGYGLDKLLTRILEANTSNT